MFPSRLPGAPMPAPVRVVKMRHLVENNLRLVFHNAELADAVIHMDFRVPDRVNWHEPLIVIAAVGGIDHTLMVGLDNAKIFESGTSGHHMRFIAFRQLHAHPQRNQSELSLF